MWPLYVFLSLLAVVVLQAFLQNWWLKTQRRKAQQEYTSALLKQQQQANAQSRARQDALFDSMVEGVLLLDENERIALVNRSLRNFFTLPAEVRGRPLEIFKWPELQGFLNRLKNEKAISGWEFDLPGNGWHLQVNATLVSGQAGEPQGFLFVFHDVTRQKKLENVRQEFVANVSHELRTPLSLIKGCAETLLNGAKDDSEAAVKFLQTIERHADRLTFLIEDLLTISQLESGQIVLNLQNFNLREFTDGVVSDLQSRAAEKSIRVENCTSDKINVHADADRIRQVLFNLIDNAIKYGRKDGRVLIDAREDGQGKIEVRVEDDGPGIPPEAQERVFERFYRVDKARSREQGGTGLGLSIVKHIVQSHGGKVWVTSEPGKGSRFYFTVNRA